MGALPEELASRLQVMMDKLELLADPEAIALASAYLLFQQSEQLDELKDQIQALRGDIGALSTR